MQEGKYNNIPQYLPSINNENTKQGFNKYWDNEGCWETLE